MQTTALLFLIAVTLSGCTSLQLANIRRNQVELTKFQTGTCDNYRDLANQNNFILRDLALLKAYQTCPDQTPLPELNSLSDNSLALYQDLLFEVKYNQAIKTASPTDDIQALFDLAKSQNFFKKREEFFKQALAIAKKNNEKILAANIKEKLDKNSPRLKTNWNIKSNTQDLFAAASDHRQWREYDKAIKLYKLILKSERASAEDHLQARKAIRMTYKTMQRKKDYLDATKYIYQTVYALWTKNKKETSLLKKYHEALTIYARTLWTEDQTSTAKKILIQGTKELKGLTSRQEIYYILARISDEAKKYQQADSDYANALAEAVLTTELQNRILWSRAWMNYKINNYELVAQLLKQLLENQLEPNDKARVNFWLANSYRQLKKEDLAQELYQQLKLEDNLGYYGLLSLRALNEKIPPINEERTPSELDLSLSAAKAIPTELAELTEALIIVNEKAFAEKSLNNISILLRKNGVQIQDDWLRIFSAYAKAGLYLPLFASLSSLQPELKERLLHAHPSLLFPQPWKELVLDSASRSQIPYELIFSVMRQESSFNPLARSPVDAYGLLQLLPSTAKIHARKNKIPYEHAEDLFTPNINIPLGASELAQLYEKYDRQFILAVAGYNANDAAIKGWLKVRYRENPIEFIEEIPYDETRAYIKLVMRNFLFYRRLNSSESFAFPDDELLNLKIRQPRSSP